VSRDAAGPDSVVSLSSDGNVVASTRRLRCEGRPQTARGGVQLCCSSDLLPQSKDVQEKESSAAQTKKGAMENPWQPYMGRVVRTSENKVGSGIG
jgi:hypothetical protein